MGKAAAKDTDSDKCRTVKLQPDNVADNNKPVKLAVSRNDKRINDHRYITPDVTCTEFEGGARVYVNFGYEDFAQDGIAVPARDYIVLREGSAK